MRWLACAWLLVVGCFEPPPFPTTTYDVTLLNASPSVVPEHGVVWVTVTYQGPLTTNFTILVDHSPTTPINFDATTGSFAFQAPRHVEGPVRVSLIESETGRELAANRDLLEYYVMPATALVESGELFQGNLDWALHAELAEPCARRSLIYVTNSGDVPLSVAGVATTDPAFTTGLPPQGCQGLEYYDHCDVTLCFKSDVAGAHSVNVTAITTVGDASITTQATVLPAQPGLDASYSGGGVRINSNEPWYDGRGIARPDGNGIAIWSRSQAISVDASATETNHSVFTTSSGFSVDWLRGMRAGAAGGGIYALIGDTNGGSISAILHFADDVTPDASFAAIDLPIDGTLGYYRSIELTPSNQILAIGSFGVVALANGVIDTTYGTAGKTTFPTQFRGESAIDSQGRLYVVLDDRVLRLTATGAIDTTFTFTGTPKVIAIDASDRVYLGSFDHAARLSNTGTESLTIVAMPTNDDIAVDASGRIYLVNNGSVRRYSATGVLDGMFGFGTANSVVCPPTGACYILGANNDTTAYPLSYFYENYVLRFAN